MNVLVSGGAGYIGSHAAKKLKRSGLDPVVFDNLSTGHRSFVRWGPFVYGDLADRESLVQALRDHEIKAVMHFAANAYVGESIGDPQKYFHNNVVNSLNLLAAMLETGVKAIIFSSSCAVYGEPEELPLPETHRLEPISPYGESKLFIEKVLRWYSSAYAFRFVCLRYFNAAGADPEGELGEVHLPETHIIPLLMHAARDQNRQFRIFGTDYPTPDGTAIRDYVHVSDIAAAHVLALQYILDGGPNMTLNLGTGIGHSVREVVRAVERTAGKLIDTCAEPRRAGDPSRLFADGSLAARTLGWQPKHSDLTEIVQSAWRWCETYPELQISRKVGSGF